MTSRILLRSVAMVVTVMVPLGAVSLYAELHGRAAASGDRRAEAEDAPAPLALSAKAPAMLEAESLTDHAQLVLLPGIPSVIRRNGADAKELEGSYQCVEGRLYRYAGGQKQRVWLFAIISDRKPELTVRN